jgi:DNA-binding NtrC family response regulator
MHTIQHAVLLANGGKIDVEHLPVAIRGDARTVSRPQAAPMAPLGTALKQFERAYLIRALAESDEKKGKAADALGISRKNLWEKLKMHGIVAAPDGDPGARAAGDGSSPFAA